MVTRTFLGNRVVAYLSAGRLAEGDGQQLFFFYDRGIPFKNPRLSRRCFALFGEDSWSDFVVSVN